MLASGVQILANPTVTAVAEKIESSATNPVKINAIEQMAKILTEYGLGFTLLALFLVVFMALFLFAFNYLQKQVDRNNKVNDSNNALAQEALKHIISEYFENKESEVKEKEVEANEAKINNFIPSFATSDTILLDALRTAMGTIHCDRVAIYLFHNGMETIYGFPFVKMSCIRDITMKNTINSIRSEKHRNMFLSSYSNIISCLISNNEYSIGNIYTHGIINADDQILHFISGSSIKAIFALAIRDNNGSIAGFSIAEFRDEKDFSDHDQYDIIRDGLDKMNNTVRPIVAKEEVKKEIIDKLYPDDSHDKK